MKKNIALINPYNGIFFPIYEEQLALGYLASQTRKAGFNVTIFEFDLFELSIKEVVYRLKELNCLIIGISLPGTKKSENFIRKLCRCIKKVLPDCILVAGGHEATFYYSMTLFKFPDIDCILLGEGDYSFPLVCELVTKSKSWKTIDGVAYIENKKIIYKPIKKRIMDIDKISFPSRDNLKFIYSKGTIPRIQSSRGCYGNCYFCNVNEFYINQNISKCRWIGRSPQNILEEIDNIVKKAPANWVNFVDDNFFGSGVKGKQRVVKFAKMLIDSYPDISWMFSCRSESVDEKTFSFLKKSGLKKLFVGIESPNQNILDRLNKHNNVDDIESTINICKKLEIDLTCGFIMFTPWTTVSNIKENLDFLESVKNIDIYTSNYLISRKGSNFYKDIKNISTPNNLGYTFLSSEIHELFKLSCKKDELVGEYLETGREIWRYVQHTPKNEEKIRNYYMQIVELDIRFMIKAYEIIIKNNKYYNSPEAEKLLLVTKQEMLSLVKDICILAIGALHHSKKFILQS